MQLEPLGDASSPQHLRLAPAEEKEMEPVRKKEEEKTQSCKSLIPALYRASLLNADVREGYPGTFA